MDGEFAVEKKDQTNKSDVLFTVTPVSKFLAVVLFVALPFLGGWIGYQYGLKQCFECDGSYMYINQEEYFTSTQNQTLSVDIETLQRSFQEQFSVADDIELQYEAMSSQATYVRTLTYSSRPSNIYRFDKNTRMFYETDYSFDPAGGDSVSPSGRFLASALDLYQATTSVAIFDFEQEEEVFILQPGSGETLWSGLCGYSGPTLDLQWEEDESLRYGVYAFDSIDYDECDTELLEYRTWQIE